MKTSQWIGVLIVLVVMVFVITIAKNFLGETRTPMVATTTQPNAAGPESASTLTFYAKSLPAEPQGSLYYEPGQAGWQDFLFENPQAEEVKIGLKHKSCECAGFQVVLASPEWKTRRAQLWAGEVLAPPMPFEAAATQPFIATNELLTPESARTLHELENALPPFAELTLETKGKLNEVVIPGKSLGWIRLAWTAGKTDKQLFNGELWIGSPSSGLNAQVETRLHFVPPLRVGDTDRNLGELNERDLIQQPFAGALHVWSSTRPALHLKAQAIRPLRYDEKRFDPFVVGEPVLLSLEECDDLKRSTPNVGVVTCAYKIPFKLYGRSPADKGGKVAVDLGLFRRRLRVWSDEDKGVEPMELTVTCSVQGNVTVASKQGSRVSLGVFESDVGSAPQTAVLTADNPGLQLEVDRERTAEFLRDSVRLEAMPPLAGLPRWKLHVQVIPNAALGAFPRDDNVLYRDSAVYLKTKGEVTQNIRIPVDGTANER